MIGACRIGACTIGVRMHACMRLRLRLRARQVIGVEAESADLLQQSLLMGHRLTAPEPAHFVDGASVMQVWNRLAYCMQCTHACMHATITSSTAPP